MRKILLLGGSAQQVVAIETARRLGYYTVLCDYLEDNPGQYHADRFYLISTTDKEAVLSVAEKEKIDGVLAYASDPAAPTAAFVAERLNLPANPYESAEILCNKDRFREFLSANGFNAPKSCSYEKLQDIKYDMGEFRLPVIVKPVDSSGSKGVSVLHSMDEIRQAAESAFSFSRSHRIIVEEYIEKKHPYLIGGDIFVRDGEIVLWGLLNCHRDSQVNPLVPVGKSFPLELARADIINVKKTLQSIVNALQIKSGGMNVELVVDRESRVWPIDIGPRSGGNMIPDLLSMIFGTDVIELSVKAAMGDDFSVTVNEGIPYYATHNLHSRRSGIFEQVRFSDELKPYIVKTILCKNPGDEVEYFDNAGKVLGVVFFRFNKQEEMKKMLSHINEHIEIVLSNV